MTTDERLETIKQELARMKRRGRWLWGAVATAVIAWMVGAVTWHPVTVEAQPATAAAKEIRAEKFILEDENGVTRAGLGTTKDGSGLVLTDENGVPRAGLSMTKDGSGLVLTDENGDILATLP